MFAAQSSSNVAYGVGNVLGFARVKDSRMYGRPQQLDRVADSVGAESATSEVVGKVVISCELTVELVREVDALGFAQVCVAGFLRSREGDLHLHDA